MTPHVLFDDRALRGITEALDPEAMTPRLAPLLPDVRSDGPWHVVAVDVLKYKPGRRCAIGYVLVSASGQRRRLFAKTYKNDRGANIFLNMQRFAEAIPRDILVLPRPLAYFPDLNLLVTEYIEGQTLATKLYAGASDRPAEEMVRALRVLHASGVACARRWTPAKELRNTNEWIRGFSGRAPAASQRTLAILSLLEERAGTLPARMHRPIHRDYYPEQLWDADGRTALLDLDDARAGDPALDVGNFLAHLVLRALQFPESREGCRRAERVFLDAYLAELDEDPSAFSRRVRFYEATSLLRLSGVYAARPRWAEALPGPLLDVCEARLNQEGDA